MIFQEMMQMLKDLNNNNYIKNENTYLFPLCDRKKQIKKYNDKNNKQFYN